MRQVAGEVYLSHLQSRGVRAYPSAAAEGKPPLPFAPSCMPALLAQVPFAQPQPPCDDHDAPCALPAMDPPMNSAPERSGRLGVDPGFWPQGGQAPPCAPGRESFDHIKQAGGSSSSASPGFCSVLAHPRWYRACVGVPSPSSYFVCSVPLTNMDEPLLLRIRSKMISYIIFISCKGNRRYRDD